MLSRVRRQPPQLGAGSGSPFSESRIDAALYSAGSWRAGRRKLKRSVKRSRYTYSTGVM